MNPCLDSGEEYVSDKDIADFDMKLIEWPEDSTGHALDIGYIVELLNPQGLLVSIVSGQATLNGWLLL